MRAGRREANKQNKIRWKVPWCGLVLQSNNSPEMQNNWRGFLLHPLVSPRTGWEKSYPIQCIVLALTLTLFNLKYLTCQIDYRIIYRWVWAQAYGCRSGLWDVQPCEGAISQHTCLILININGNRASLLGELGLPSLALCLGCLGTMVQISRGNSCCWPLGAGLPKLVNIPFWGVPGVGCPTPLYADRLYIFPRPSPLSRAQASRREFNLHGDEPATNHLL